MSGPAANPGEDVEKVVTIDDGNGNFPALEANVLFSGDPVGLNKNCEEHSRKDESLPGSGVHEAVRI